MRLQMLFRSSRAAVGLAFGVAAGIAVLAFAQGTAPTDTSKAVATVAGMPPAIDPSNLYSETTSGRLSAMLRKSLTVMPMEILPARTSHRHSP